MWIWAIIAFASSVMFMTLCLCKAASKEDQYIELQYEKLDKNNKNKL